MRHLRTVFFMLSSLTVIGMCLGLPPEGMAQVPPGIPNSEPGPPNNRNNKRVIPSRPRGGLRISGAPAGAIRKEVEKKNDANRPNLKQIRDTQFYRIAVARPDGSFLGLSYYPALPGDNPPVVMLIHEKDRSSRDFTDKIEEFKDPNGLASALQADGFAVVTLDVAGLTDPRKRNAGLTKDEPAKHATAVKNQTTAKIVEQSMIDLRLTYQFLVDRHNRLEFNLGKLTILTLGEGANVALEWVREATQPTQILPGIRPNPADPRQKHPGAHIAAGERDSATDRPSDISAVIMISPVESWQHIRTTTALKSYLDGSPVPVLVLGGTNDKDSANTLKLVKPIVERRESRLSKVEELDTGLHGARLLRFEPGLVPKINRFLEQTVEFQKTDWEPRYNLAPVAYKLVEAVSKTAAEAASRAAAATDKPAVEKTKAAPKAADEKSKTETKPADEKSKTETKPVDSPTPAPPKPAEVQKPIP